VKHQQLYIHFFFSYDLFWCREEAYQDLLVDMDSYEFTLRQLELVAARNQSEAMTFSALNQSKCEVLCSRVLFSHAFGNSG